NATRSAYGGALKNERGGLPKAASRRTSSRSTASSSGWGVVPTGHGTSEARTEAVAGAGPVGAAGSKSNSRSRSAAAPPASSNSTSSESSVEPPNRGGEVMGGAAPLVGSSSSSKSPVAGSVTLMLLPKAARFCETGAGRGCTIKSGTSSGLTPTRSGY